MLSKSTKTAVLFYGQFRTAEYTAPWLRKMVNSFGPDTEVFADIQLTERYDNLDAEHKFQAPDYAKVHTVMTEVCPTVNFRTDETIAPKLNNKHGYWHYARMFCSMNRVYGHYQEWAMNNEEVDLLVLARLDALVGPHPESLAATLESRGVDKYTVYTDGAPIRFNGPELGLGVPDLVLAGSPFALGSVISYCADSVSVDPRLGYKRYHAGPNVHIKDAIDASSLRHISLNLPVALVRPNADLSRPVMTMESFHYHAKFWRENHKGMTNEQ